MGHQGQGQGQHQGKENCKTTALDNRSMFERPILGWLLLAPTGSRWLLLAPSGSSWLLLAPLGFSGFLLAHTRATLSLP